MINKLVVERKELFADGHEFPVTGAYEKIVGKLYGEVDPRSGQNKVIVNLDKAPRNKRGRVEYWSSLYLLKPVDMERGNQKIFVDPTNRGGKQIVASLNDAPSNNDPSTLQDAGNGFLMREGYTIAWTGWHGGLSGRNFIVMDVPTATDKGKEIVGLVRTELVSEEAGVYSMPLSADPRIVSYEAADTDKSKAILTAREKFDDLRMPVPVSGWDYARCEKDAAGGNIVRPSTTDLYLRSGFKPNHLYEFIYPAKNPLVLGLGFAAVRDWNSWLKYATAADGNPLANYITNIYTEISSQPGRMFNDFRKPGSSEISSIMASTRTSFIGKFSTRSVRTSPAAAERF